MEDKKNTEAVTFNSSVFPEDCLLSQAVSGMDHFGQDS